MNEEESDQCCQILQGLAGHTRDLEFTLITKPLEVFKQENDPT
jgi:hypothetical protein